MGDEGEGDEEVGEGEEEAGDGEDAEEQPGEEQPVEELVELAPSGPPPMGMSYERLTAGYVRMNATAVGERDARLADEAEERRVNAGFRGSDEVENLRELLRAKFGSTLRGWRFGLDIRNQHRVSKTDFFKALRSLGYPGSSKATWAQLGGDLAGRDGIALADVDATVAQAIAAFFREYTTYLGKMHNLVEKSYALVISKAEFMTHCKLLLNYEVDLNLVFSHLQTNGFITSDDCAWLEHYMERRCSYCKKLDHPRCRCPLLPDADALEGGDALAKVEVRAAAQAAKRTRMAADDFRRQLQHYYGSTVSAWRKRLDPDGTGVIANEQLWQVAQRIHFKGDISDVWTELTGGGDYTVKLEDLEPRAMQVMSAFDRACKEHYGGFARAFRALDARKKPMVTREEFQRLCVEINMESNHKLLFDLLDDRRVGVILLQSINEEAAAEVCGKEKCEKAAKQLQELEPDSDGSMRKTLMQRTAEFGERWSQAAPPRNHHEELLALLTRKFGSPIRAWSAVLDLQGKGKLSKEEFAVGCSAAGFGGSPGRIWEELGLKANGSIKLRDLAPAATEEFKLFKTNTLHKLSDENGFIVEDKSGENRKIYAEEFKAMAKKAGMRDAARVDRVFEGLDLQGQGFVMSRTLRWLHDAKSASKALPSVLHKYKDAKRKLFQERIETNCQKPLRDTLKAQDTLRDTAKEKLAAKNALEEAHKKLTRIMCKRHGGIAKAWLKNFDPERKGELKQNEFFSGLKKLGMLPQKGATQEQLELAGRLFNFFADEATQTVSLAGMDPYVDFLMTEFKRQCVDRFGSLALAFRQLNPEASESIPADRLRLACHQVKLGNAVHRMMEYLDPDNTGEVRLRDLSEQAALDAEEMVKKEIMQADNKVKRDKRERRSHMAELKDNADLQVATGPDVRRLERKQEAAQRALRDFKERLCHRHGTLVKAWRKLFQAEEVSFEDFETIYASQGLKAPASVVWEALGLAEDEDEGEDEEEEEEDEDEEQNVLTLLDLDQGIAIDLEELRGRISERFGTAAKAFVEVGGGSNYKLDQKLFFKLCYEVQLRGNERRLFDYLDTAGKGSVALEEIDKTAVKELKQSGVLKKSPKAGDAEQSRENDPVPGFKALLLKRYGKSMVRAWRAIDKHGSSQMTRGEFAAAIVATGYRGSFQLLWNGLVGKEAKTIWMRDLLDAGSFKGLVRFYRTIVGKSETTTLKQAFSDETEEPVKRFSREEFFTFCRDTNFQKPGPVFALLATSDGFVGWEEVRFLEEQWSWEAKEPSPVRKKPPPPDQQRPSGLYPGLPARTLGEGALMTNLRPQRVTMRRFTSLPTLRPEFRPQWNDRHQIKDIPSNKTEQLIHLMAYVQTQNQERIKLKVEQRMKEEPVGQWLVKNVLKEPVEDDEEQPY